MTNAIMTFSLREGADALWAKIKRTGGHDNMFLCLAATFQLSQDMSQEFERQSKRDDITLRTRTCFKLNVGDVRFCTISPPERWIGLQVSAAWICPSGDYTNWPDRIRTRLAATGGILIVTEH